jgi:hypothetical protein
MSYLSKNWNLRLLKNYPAMMPMLRVSTPSFTLCFRMRYLLPIVVTLVWGLNVSAAPPLIGLVLSSDDPPPGESFLYPMTNRTGINASGSILFAANVGTNVGINRGVLRWSKGTVTHFLTINDAAPGLEGEILGPYPPPGYMDRDGHVTSLFSLKSGGEGVWRSDSPDLTSISLLGADGSRPFRFINPPRVAQEGTVAIVTTVSTGGTTGANSLVTARPGQAVRTLLTGGDPVPVPVDADDPEKTIAGIRDMSIDNSGKISCIVSRNAFGDFGMILSYFEGAGWSEVARLFTVAPGTADEFKRFNLLTVAAETVVFTATTTKGVNGQHGIWRARNGSVELIALAAESFGDGP